MKPTELMAKDPMVKNLMAKTAHCVACGLCLPHCPTYNKTQSETDSPRGRILLTQAVVQGILPINERYMAHMDLCLTCRACERACPNHVPYGAIADQARAMLHQQRRPPLWQRLAAWALTQYRLLQFGGWLLRMAQKIHLRRWFPALPAVSRQYQWKTFYPAAEAHDEVALFRGCINSVMDGETLAAGIYVLNRLGYNVHMPTEQTCCGGLHRQSGDSKAADRLDAQNRAAFTRDLPTLTVASGCGARLMETLPGKVQDITAFLQQAQGWERVSIQPLGSNIGSHEACTLRVMKAEKAQQALLKRIPQANITPLPGNAQCCGGAGSYMLTQAEMANRLRDDKIQEIEIIKSDIVATANIGCAMHLARGLDEAGKSCRIMHPVTLLARQMGFNGEL